CARMRETPSHQATTHTPIVARAGRAPSSRISQRAPPGADSKATSAAAYCADGMSSKALSVAASVLCTGIETVTSLRKMSIAFTTIATTDATATLTAPVAMRPRAKPSARETCARLLVSMGLLIENRCYRLPIRYRFSITPSRPERETDPFEAQKATRYADGEHGHTSP